MVILIQALAKSGFLKGGKFLLNHSTSFEDLENRYLVYFAIKEIVIEKKGKMRQ